MPEIWLNITIPMTERIQIQSARESHDIQPVPRVPSEFPQGLQTLYQRAVIFAARKHGEQRMLDGLPYLVHLSNVAMEILFAATQTEGFNLQFALPVALLHDVLEDTETKEDELELLFGKDVARAVKALTKDDKLPAENRMSDSLRRIKMQAKEVGAIKLADRITNLQPPPAQWTKGKIRTYREEAVLIHAELKEANAYLAERLQREIEKYAVYCSGL